jgi:hypothetical protein
MGFFDEIFGKSDVRQEVRRYFDGRSSDYEAFRRCMYDMIAVRFTTHDMNADNYMGKIRDELLAQNGSPVMRDFIVVALQRISVSPVKPQSVNFLRIYDKIVVWYDPEPMNQKPSGMLRYDLLINDNVGYAWVALYDDGTRMSKNIPGLEGSGWKVAVLSETKTPTISKIEANIVQNSISTPPKTESVRADNGDISWYRHCYRIANETGKSEAWYELGQCYLNGRGVSVNVDEAFVCYRNSAAQGNPHAFMQIGNCYLQGIGVSKDVIEAYAYFCLSGSTDFRLRSGNEIIWCVDYLTPSEVKAGKARANELRREIGF